MQALLPLLLLGGLIFMMVIRPQRAMKRKRAELMGALSEGDEIVTIGGLYGVVRDVADDTIDVEISEGVIARFDRRAVASITRDIPADEADEHRISDDDEDDDEAAPTAEASDDGAEPVAASTDSAGDAPR